MNTTCTVSVPFGGTYREEWDDRYHLNIRYEGQRELPLCFADGCWQLSAENLPDEIPETSRPFSLRFFSEAASAQVTARRFVASGFLSGNVSSLSPGGITGSVFAPELLRILMDDYDLPMETVWPVAASCFGEAFSEDELSEFRLLQPRTAALYELLLNLRSEFPIALHDIRLASDRFPSGAVRQGEHLRLAFRFPDLTSFTSQPDPTSRPVSALHSTLNSQLSTLSSASLELIGDGFSEEYPMSRDGDRWIAAFSAPQAIGPCWYRFRLETPDRGAFWLCAGPDGLRSAILPEQGTGFRLTVFERDFDTPAWFRESVMYQIFPDRFAFSDDGEAARGIEYHRGLGQNPELHASPLEEVRWQPREFETDYSPDDFYGGRLDAIRRKLPYLRELGITVLYLNPIVEARSNHRYDASDYLRVDPILGTNEDFERLCDEAASCGIRILCDGVFSHTGADSIYFNRDGHYPEPGACQSVPTPYDTWYLFRHFPDEYQSWWGFRDLPEVNEHDPSWQQYVVTGENSVVRRWLRMGASGWRLDVADELPDDVLGLIRRAAKEENPDAVILGEVWEDAVLKESYGSRRNYALGPSLDSVMNYPFRTAVLDFLHGRQNAFELAAFLTGQRNFYPQPLYFSLMNFLGTHDTERILTNLAVAVTLKELSREEQLRTEAEVCDGAWEMAAEFAKLAVAIQFSVPGVPSVYYGDEQAMRGTNDPFNRRPFRVDPSNDAIYRAVKEWASRRNENQALRRGDGFFAASDPDVLMILRYCGGNSNHLSDPVRVASLSAGGRDFSVSVAAYTVSESAAPAFCLTVINRSSEPRRFSLEANGIVLSGTVSARDAVFLQND